MSDNNSLARLAIAAGLPNAERNWLHVAYVAAGIATNPLFTEHPDNRSLTHNQRCVEATDLAVEYVNECPLGQPVAFTRTLITDFLQERLA